MTQERIARNQSTFREANERIEAAAGDIELSGPVPFICECANRDCVEILRLTLEEYEAVRRHPRRFINAPGHEADSVDAGADDVVECNGGYVVVDKIGVAGEIAAAQYRGKG